MEILFVYFESFENYFCNNYYKNNFFIFLFLFWLTKKFIDLGLSNETEIIIVSLLKYKSIILIA